MINITRDEAQRRSCGVRTSSYQVLVDLSGRHVEDPETFISTTTAHFSTDGQPSHLDLSLIHI